MVMDFEPAFDAERSFEIGKELLANTISARVEQRFNSMLLEENPSGNETSFNGRLAQVIDDSIRELRSQLSNFEIISKAKSMSPRLQEGATGSDLAIFFEVNDPLGNNLRSKTLLVQCKSGKLIDFPPPATLHASNKDLRRQLRTIERLSPNDGFLFIHTRQGGFCVSALEALSTMKRNNIRSTSFTSCGTFLRSLIACTSGNCRAISPVMLNVKRVNHVIDFDDAAEKLTAKAKSLGAPFENLQTATVTVIPH